MCSSDLFEGLGRKQTDLDRQANLLEDPDIVQERLDREKKKQEEEKQRILERERQLQEAKRAEEQRKAEEARQAELRRQEEERRIEEQKRQEELKKQEEGMSPTGGLGKGLHIRIAFSTAVSKAFRPLLLIILGGTAF